MRSSDRTLAVSRSASIRPLILWRTLSAECASPPLDEAIEEELIEFVERRADELGDPLPSLRG